jgi:hypothetical protein
MYVSNIRIRSRTGIQLHVRLMNVQARITVASQFRVGNRSASCKQVPLL